MEQFIITILVAIVIVGNTHSSPAPSLSTSAFSSSPSSSSSSSSSSSHDLSPLFKSRHARSTNRHVRHRVCSTNTPCMWAYCPWSPRVLLENDDCKYIESICVCHWTQTCTRTNDVRPDNAYLTVPFVCK